MVRTVLDDRDLSKALYGSSHMHAVVVAIDSTDTDEFSAPEIASITGLAGSSIHVLISRLIRIGVIERAGGLPGERTLLYRKTKPDVLRMLAHIGDPIS